MTTNDASLSAEDEDETKKLINYMIRECVPRFNSCFNTTLSTITKSTDQKREKATLDSLDIAISGDKDGNYAYVAFRPIDPCFAANPYGFPRDLFFKGNSEVGKEVLAGISDWDVLNYVYISNSGSCASLGKFPDEMLNAFLTSSDGRSSIIQAPMTILDGHFSRQTLNKCFPYIQSSNVILNCSSGFVRSHYYDLIEINRYQTCLHFDKHITQKFSKKKHFDKLRQIVLSNPSIDCLSFTCSFKKFNFEEFFVMIADPTFKIPHQTINLCFTFLSKNISLLEEEVNQKSCKLYEILSDRAQVSDCIRVRFNTVWDKYTDLALAPGEMDKYA